MEWMLMPLKRYADFSGRSRRMEYWMFVLFQFLVTIVINVVMMIVGGTTVMAAGNAPGAILAAGGAFMIFGLVYLLFWLAMLIPSVAVGVRRLHDTGRSGWWMLAPLAGYGIAIVGGAVAAASPNSPGLGGVLAVCGMLVAMGLAITLIVFLFLDGTSGPNKYGPDPKGQAHEQVFA